MALSPFGEPAFTDLAGVRRQGVVVGCPSTAAARRSGFPMIARVGVNDHRCSEVIASAGLAALVMSLFIRLFRMQPAQATRSGAPSRLTKGAVIG